MPTNTQYNHIAFTKHARERMQERIITEKMVRTAIRYPDRTYIEDDGDTKFICRVDGARLHVVCKPVPEEDKWLVKSTWVRGEDDLGKKPYTRRYSVRPTPVMPRAALAFFNLLFAAGALALLALLIYTFSR